MRRAKKRKGIEAQKIKHPTPSWTIDALIGDEEQSEKKKKKKEKQGVAPQPTYPGPYLVIYNVQGSYGEPIPFTPLAHSGGVWVQGPCALVLCECI